MIKEEVIVRDCGKSATWPTLRVVLGAQIPRFAHPIAHLYTCLSWLFKNRAQQSFPERPITEALLGHYPLIPPRRKLQLILRFLNPDRFHFLSDGCVTLRTQVTHG